MLQYVITALAGIAIGIVIMRVLQAKEPGEAASASSTDAAPQAPASAEAAPAPAAAGGLLAKFSRTQLLLGAAGALVLVAVAALALRSPPAEEGATTLPATASAAGASEAGLPDVDTMIERLTEKLKANPNDGEGFRMLGWSYVMTGRPQQALEPYRQALKLLPANALVHSGYGEALVGVAGGTVTDDAHAQFEQTAKLDPAEPRARYFLALWLAQHGRKQEALDQWIKLANESPAEMPWQGELRANIEKTAGELGVDVTGKLKPLAPAPAASGAPQLSQADIAAATSLPQDQQQKMIHDMVDGLAAKLKTNPADPDGWVRLLRSRMVLGQADQAGKDLLIARQALSGDPAGLKLVNAAAVQFAVPGA